MTATGVYYIPESSSSASPSRGTFKSIVDHISKKYAVEPIGRWALEHRLMRETAAQLNRQGQDDRSSADQKNLQILTLSHHPGRSYVGVTTSPRQLPQKGATPLSAPSQAGDLTDAVAPPAVIAVPSPVQSEELNSLLLTRMGPLWTSRLTLVAHGLVFKIGDFGVRVAEVKLGQGSTSSQTYRGTIIEAEWAAAGGDPSLPGSLQPEEIEFAEEVIKSLWQELKLPEGKSAIRIPENGEEEFSFNRLNTAKQYLEVLRSR
ncbi:MAG: hypothetical protein M4579_004517 [Chaenotheca gracillima]|nr:MAG: hypothetical protein M4579_004517 [Chaenotheca gracillima]